MATLRSSRSALRTTCRAQQQPSTAYSSRLPARASAPVVESAAAPRRDWERDPLYYPSAEIEEAEAHNAFLSAYESAKPMKLRVAKLQEFCAALVQRRRHIPSTGGGDALSHMFMEVDTDNDGLLAAEELSDAFQSHGVPITVKHCQELMDDFLGAKGGKMTREQWPDFVLALAVADLHVRSHQSSSGSSSSGSSMDSM